MPNHALAAVFAGTLSALVPAGGPGELAPPVRVKAAGKPIDVDVGHAAPLLHDLDGDGLPDLLLGQFGGGKLRIYLNRGRPGKPDFRNYAYLKAAGELAKVPAS
jgi:hypothetical protein